MDSEYHKSIFSRYGNYCSRDINFACDIETIDGVVLQATEQITKSKIGLHIDTGMTVPRESFYPVFSYFPDLNILVYDKRGHGESEGTIDNVKCIADNQMIARKWKEERHLDVLIGFGHSYGGMIMTHAGQDLVCPYDAIIAAGAPVDLKKAVGLIPESFSRTSLFLYNIGRLGKRFSWDPIVSHHRKLNPMKFKGDPRVVAMRVDDAGAFNEAMTSMSRLTDMVEGVRVPAFYFYGGEDRRLGIHGSLEGDYLELYERCRDLGLPVTLIPGVSHRFNKRPELDFAFSYNNNLVLEEMRMIVDRYR